MTQLASQRRMTVAEFLDWDDGTDTRYELVDGFPVAQAAPILAHALVVTNIGGELRSRLRPPCQAFIAVGIALPGRDHCHYKADVAVSCAVVRPDQRSLPDPVVIVEVLSPSTADHDRQVKRVDYRAVPSVREIVLIDPVRRFAEVHRRLEGDRWLTDRRRGADAVLCLESVGVDLPFTELYRGIDD